MARRRLLSATYFHTMTMARRRLLTTNSSTLLILSAAVLVLLPSSAATGDHGPDYSYSGLLHHLRATAVVSRNATAVAGAWSELSDIIRLVSSDPLPLRSRLEADGFNVSEPCMNQTLLWLTRILEIKPWAMAGK